MLMFFYSEASTYFLGGIIINAVNFKLIGVIISCEARFYCSSISGPVCNSCTSVLGIVSGPLMMCVNFKYFYSTEDENAVL